MRESGEVVLRGVEATVITAIALTLGYMSVAELRA